MQLQLETRGLKIENGEKNVPRGLKQTNIFGVVGSFI